LILAVALTLSSCCFSSCGPKKENYTSDVPATLKDAKALAKAGQVTVEVERVTKTAGGGGCGHSGLCLVFVPIMLYDAMFPEQWDVVTVKSGEAETFTGTYKTNGELIEGRLALPGGETKQVAWMQLDALNKRVLVEVARFRPGPDAGLIRTPTPLATQHDFVTDYRAALKDESKPDKRGALLRESLQWLDAEALPLVKERLADAAEPDAAKAAVMDLVCAVHTTAPSSLEAPLIVAVGDHPPPLTAIVLLGCADDDVRRGKLLALIAAAICTEEEPAVVSSVATTAADATAEKAELRTQVDKAVGACTKPDRRALYALLTHQPVEQAPVVALLTGRHTAITLSHLDFTIASHRAAYFEALGKGASTELLLGRLEQTHPLNGAELAEVARAASADHSFLSDSSMNATLLLELEKSRDAGVDVAPARKVLTAARDAAKPVNQPLQEIALFALGDRSRAGPAARGAEAPVSSHHRHKSRGSNFIWDALIRSGCTEPELKAFQARSDPKLVCAGWK
jgi:hypothetical protein